jgi:hypothetical protein
MLAMRDERREKEKDNAPGGSEGKLVASNGLREKNEDQLNAETQSEQRVRGRGGM